MVFVIEPRTVALTDSADTFDGTSELSGVLVYANRGADFIMGSAFADSLYSYLGADTLRGAGGNDLIQDDGGNNLLRGGEGDDTILTGSMGAQNNNTIYGGLGDDSIGAAAGNNLAFGGAGNDTLDFSQTAASSTIQGNEGNDYIVGFGELRGGQGNDTITAITTSDVYGDKGNDSMDASNATAGLDSTEVRFYFASGSGVDTISQFELGTNGDKIVLTANLNNSGILTASDVVSHIHLVGASVDAGTGAADYRIDFGGGNQVSIDIVSSGQTALTANDFIII